MDIKIPVILVIEDSTSIRLFIQQVLEGGRYETYGAKGGFAGLEQSKNVMMT
jgi:CheY-like chemotaxis protein